MPKHHSLIAALLLLLPAAPSLRADTAAVVSAANAFKATLSSSQISTLQISYTAANAEAWTNLPGSRNGIQLGTLSSTQLTAALALVQTALSDAGYSTFAAIRAADDILAQSANGYGSGNYYIVFTGAPSTSSPWLLQILGHHLAYNITYNGNYIDPTPVFLGTEPPYYTSNGTTYYPLGTQRAAVAALADAIQADSNVSSAAKLSGTFTDVVHGSNGTNSRDTNFPQAYATGTTGRGVLYSSLTSSEQALVKTLIEAYVNTQKSDFAAPLLAHYESAPQLAETYIGYGVGTSGTASFPEQPSGTSTQHSYLRVDGPRVWIEFVVQQGVVYSSNIHYHSLWRDKVADYGAEFGQASTSDPGALANYTFFSGAASLGSENEYLAFSDGNPFGYYNAAYAPYLYHYDAGFSYFLDAGDSVGGAYLYDFTSGAFWYTSPTLWPYVYDFGLNSYLYYYPNTSDKTRYTTNPRYFYNFGTGAIITR